VTWWQAALLGVLQGLTEFLPVSSSGHLALAQHLIPGFSQPGVVFDAVLHVGTALAIIWFERRALLRWLHEAEGVKVLGLLIAGTAATAVPGFALRSQAEADFTRLVWVGGFFMLTGVIVLATYVLPGGERVVRTTGWKQAVLIGLAQGCAVFPGISRSGSTIAAGLGCGLEREWAARFSFLLGVPAIAGATLVEVVGHAGRIEAAGSSFWIACGVGGVTAAVTGYFALGLVLRAVTSRVFYRFAWYCLPLGLLVLAASWMGWL
jgi:undecaprenyl-diphosphatase